MYRLQPARRGDKVPDLWSPLSSSNHHPSKSSVSQFQSAGERACDVGETGYGCDGSGRIATNVRVAAKKRSTGAVLVAVVFLFVLVSTAAKIGGRRRFNSRLLVGERGDPLAVLDSAMIDLAVLDSAVPKAATTSSAVGDAASSAAPTPVVIALMNRFYFGDRYARVISGCTWGKTGASLPCEFTADQARFNDSSALA